LAEDKVKVHYNWEVEDIEEDIKKEDKEQGTKKENKEQKPRPEKKKVKKTTKKEIKPKKKKKIKEEITEDTTSIKEEEEENLPKEEEKEEETTEDITPIKEEEEENLPKEEEKTEETFTEEDLTSEEEKEEKGLKSGYLVAFVAIVIIVVLSFFILRTKISPTLSNEENIVAFVNGERITAEDLEKVYKMTVPLEYAGFISKEDFLNQSLVPEKVLLQEAGKQGIMIEDEEVQEGLGDFLLENRLTEDELKRRLGESNVDFNDFLENFRIRLIITKLLDKTVLSQIIINDFEIVDYYENNKRGFIAEKDQIRARHILIETEDLAKEILEKLEKGADFSELAKTHSIDPSSAFGGDLGFFGSGQMVKEFEEAAFNLEIGEISDIVKTTFGYHIIKRENNEMPLEEAKERIRLTLLASKKSTAIQMYINQLVSQADIFIESDISPITGLVPKGTRTFIETSDPICKEDGKPVIRLYTTSWCPHCNWIKDTFDGVVRDYVEQGKIIAHHWDVDIGDDILTSEQETSIPESEIEILRKYNPQGSIPTFVFGCKYARIGNAYEAENDLSAEEAEFREIIEELLSY